MHSHFEVVILTRFPFHDSPLVWLFFRQNSPRLYTYGLGNEYVFSNLLFYWSARKSKGFENVNNLYSYILVVLVGVEVRSTYFLDHRWSHQSRALILLSLDIVGKKETRGFQNETT